jgi:RNA polymerase sigma-70 factor (ECF subfamily)
LADVLPDDPDRDVLPAAMAGDVDAFGALVRRYQARMVGLARTLTGVPEDAEDLAQEVFVRVFRSLGAFRGDSVFRTWLYRVAINVSRTHRSRRLRERAVWQDSGEDDETSLDPPDRMDVEADLIARDAIGHALDRLPEALRTAVTLRDVHGLDYRDIAEATGVPIGTVESRIFRARQRLRAWLAPLNLA